ncbi:FAD-dependent monooxygenase [Microbacterium sp. cx-55]|uniref:FAD-dependent oxidoreductase n=1 Tax=unclassified Microbacterium TaxID=2609290 RepID=UPI001CBEDB1D|nr:MULTISPECIES: NAD(P)/FAD-dependent oxidoreductase [unclassified Microbacterium]MBZ4488421.1 FAD-dependent monooxygenase [Microbacterium sp. cx-55]MCC4909516.1 FAD-dependent monooxygenase [Microbacterium sp. cx-59]UGB35071.1 FAD-dependent monooxygenase [Microbacterium sp. cx-55]
MADVVVVGAGPVGLLLASELHRRGIGTRLLERRPSAGGGSRAIGVHSPVLAALEPSGVTERLLASALRVHRGEARSGAQLLGTVHFDRLRARFPFVATLPQSATEAALAHGGPPVQRGAEVTRIRRVGDRMRISLRGGDDLDAGIVVVATGAGGRAVAYRPGAVRVHSYADRYLMSDTDVGYDDPTAIVRLGRRGVLESFPLPGERRRYVAWDDDPDDDRPDARLERFRRALAAHGEGAAAERVAAASGFRVRRVVVPRMRRGTLFVIGDGAHEVSPIGGQGMNLGLLDAAGLAPLLAEWVRRGEEPAAALARWERRRLTSARTAAALASANTALGRPLGPRGDALRRRALRAVLSGPSGMLFAHAYAMGLDRDA